MKGPVAIAGSIPLLCRKSGVKVPIKPATTITAIREVEMARAVKKFPFQNQVKSNKIAAKIMPFKSAKSTSLINLLPVLPFKSSLAKP